MEHDDGVSTGPCHDISIAVAAESQDNQKDSVFEVLDMWMMNDVDVERRIARWIMKVVMHDSTGDAQSSTCWRKDKTTPTSNEINVLRPFQLNVTLVLRQDDAKHHCKHSSYAGSHANRE